MTEPQQHFYQAIGVVEGILTLRNPRSFITVGDTLFHAYVPKSVRKKCKSGQVQTFRVYPQIRHTEPSLQIVSVVDSKPTPITLNGCWELHKGVPHFVIYRNGVMNPGDRILRNVVPVVWENPPPADGQFWQAESQLRDGAFVVTKAEGPFDPPPKATEYIPPQPKTLKNLTESVAKPQPSASTSVNPLTPQEIRAMATAVKAQVMCKLNQVPKHRELPDKRVEFFLADGDRIFTVKMKPKMFKKLTDHGFSEWVASITGDLGPATETGFELENASLQIFEKKAKAEPGAEVKAEAKPEAKTTTSQAIQRTAEVKPSGKKSLLSGVTMR